MFWQVRLAISRQQVYQSAWSELEQLPFLFCLYSPFVLFFLLLQKGSLRTAVYCCFQMLYM